MRSRLLVAGLILLVGIGAVLRWTFQREQVSAITGVNWQEAPEWTFDWDVYRAACRALLAGENPYQVGAEGMRFFNPPWALIPLIPLAYLPRISGLVALGVASTISLALITRRLGISLWSFVLIATSVMHLGALLNGNIEFLPWLGVLFPAPVALLFFTIKPQSTLGVIILLLLNQWEAGGWKAVALTLAPTAVLSVLSLLVWGIPPLASAANPVNLSFFPASLLIGLPALALALIRRSVRTAALAGPFLTPYTLLHSYLPVMFGLKGGWLALAWLGPYVFLVVRSQL